MWLGIGYIIPMIGDRNLRPPISEGNFIALETSLNDIMLLEDGGKTELENQN